MQDRSKKLKSHLVYAMLEALPFEGAEFVGLGCKELL